MDIHASNRIWTRDSSKRLQTHTLDCVATGIGN